MKSRSQIRQFLIIGKPAHAFFGKCQITIDSYFKDTAAGFHQIDFCIVLLD